MKNSILGKARWLRDVALATSKNNGARVAREWLKYAAMFVMLFTIGVGNVWGETFSKVTDVGSLSAGDEILIVNETSKKALGTTQNTSNRAAVAVTITTNTITDPANTVQVITLGKAEHSTDGKTYWTLIVGTNEWLYAASSKSNLLKTQTELDDNGKWDIAISDGNATITAQGSNTRNLLKYNSSSTLFSCYASGQQPVQIYKKAPTITYTVTWMSNGSQVRKDTDVPSGTAKTPPTISPLPCGDKLMGWTDAAGGAYVHGKSNLYTGATINITGDVVLYAVFADEE